MVYYFDIHQIDYGKLNREQLNKVNKHNALDKFLSSNATGCWTITKFDIECSDYVKLLRKNTFFRITLDSNPSIHFRDSLGYVHSKYLSFYNTRYTIENLLK